MALPETFVHPQLGTVHVSARRAMRNIVARWRAGAVHVSAPPTVSTGDLRDALDRMAPRLLAKRPAARFSPGQVINVPGLRITLEEQTARPDEITVSVRLPEARVGVGSRVGWDNEAFISRALARVAAMTAEELLLPRARALAREKRAEPAGWKISRGARTLGTCHASGIISLSSRLVFLPLHLRDYVVCHELAHLTEMNHSSAFHRLCDLYCGGRERELTAQLRAYEWPLLR